jgi:hypothetical protein
MAMQNGVAERQVDIGLVSQLQSFLADRTKAPLKEPTNNDKVYKDECTYCFDSSFSKGKINV